MSTLGTLSSVKDQSFNEGVRFALLAYVSWGLFPFFWKMMKDIPAIEILFHRIFWAFIFYTILRVYKEKKVLGLSGLKTKEIFYLLLASIFLTTNWFLYIYAVNSGQVVEASLAYFINPLVNILVGVLFLKESLKKHHKVAIAIVSVGVVILTLEAHRLPIIAIALALLFSFYGYIRKRLPIESLAGGQLETFFVVPVAIFYFFSNNNSLLAHSSYQWGLIVASGVVTGLPLLWFTEAVKRLPYYLMGFFQFLAPTLTFISARVFFKEEMSPLKFMGFVFIWAGILYLMYSTFRKNKVKKDVAIL